MAYRDAAVTALEGALGEARTAELAGRQWVAGASTHSFARSSWARATAGWARRPAGSRASNPHARGRPRAGGTVEALDRAADAVQAVRVSLDRSDVAGTRAALDELRAACTALEGLAEDLS